MGDRAGRRALTVRAVVQRVTQASVGVDDVEIATIGGGLLVLVGVAVGDGPADLDYLASKVAELRIFTDDTGRMNRSVIEAGGAVLVVSQFTLLGDVRRGRRPAFDAAETPDRARDLYEALILRLRQRGLVVEAGQFQAHMRVALVNDGPVTVLVDSRRVF